MDISKSIVKKIAHLARLYLTDKELAEQEEKLGTILTWVEQLSEINTDGTDPLYHPLEGSVQPKRADEVTEQNNRDELIALCSSHEAGLYLVPKVID